MPALLLWCLMLLLPLHPSREEVRVAGWSWERSAPETPLSKPKLH